MESSIERAELSARLRKELYVGGADQMARDKFSLTRPVHLMHPRVYLAIWKVIGQNVCWSHWKWDNSTASGVRWE